MVVGIITDSPLNQSPSVGVSDFKVILFGKVLASLCQWCHLWAKDFPVKHLDIQTSFEKVTTCISQNCDGCLDSVL